MNSNSLAKEEELFVNAFVYPSKRSRTLGLLKSKKRRTKFLSQLFHYPDFDPRFLQQIDPSAQFVESILNILLSKGAGSDCYVISVSSDLDQTRGILVEILETVIGYYPGTIISCIPGKLAYYEAEMNNERYILERSKG